MGVPPTLITPISTAYPLPNGNNLQDPQMATKNVNCSYLLLIQSQHSDRYLWHTRGMNTESEQFNDFSFKNHDKTNKSSEKEINNGSFLR